MATEPPPLPGAEGYPPGWYPDPSQVDAVRWYDGSAWTDQVAAAPKPPRRRGRTLLWIGLGVLAILIGGCGSLVFLMATDGAGGVDAAEVADRVHRDLTAGGVECTEWWVHDETIMGTPQSVTGYCEMGDEAVLEVSAFSEDSSTYLARAEERPECPWYQGDHFVLTAFFPTDDTWTEYADPPSPEARSRVDDAMRVAATRMNGTAHSCP